MKEFYLGCDVSKGYADFILLNKQKKVEEQPFQLDDTFDGHNALTDFLKKFFSSNSDSNLFVAVESTGGYENNWYNLLLRLGEIHPLQVTRLNGYGIKKHHEASMKRNVTDAIAAKNIASYMISYPEKIIYNQDTSFQRLCRLWTSIHLLVKQRTQLLNQLNILLYQSQPDLLQYCKKSVPTWILTLLKSYPTANKLAKARPTTVTKISSVTLEKAQLIIGDAKKSVAAHVDENDEFMITQNVKQIKNLDTSIEEHKKYLEKKCTLPEVDLLCSFIGIGTYSAIGLMINIVSIARFSTIKHLASYFGLHPIYRQSGDGSWGNHMSKQGRKEPREILFMVVRSAIVHNPTIKQLYENCLAKGMVKMAALGVCMHKTLRIVYGMLRTNKLFDPAIDLKNQSDKKTGSKKKRVDKKRRFQASDAKAPISRRQTKTRKEKEVKKEPQETINPMNGVIQPLPKLKMIQGKEQNQRKNGLQQLGEILVEAVVEYEKNK